MLAKRMRVTLALLPEQDGEELLARLEELLGRPAKPVWRLQGGRLLSLWLTARELERVRELPGLRSAAPEERADTPVPVRPRRERD